MASSYHGMAICPAMSVLMGLSKVIDFQFVVLYFIVRMGVTMQALFILELKIEITKEIFKFTLEFGCRFCHST